MTNHKFKKVTSLEELKNICDGVSVDFFIQLNFGLRSSKNISYNRETDQFFVLNEIDDFEQILNSQQIQDEDYTNIGKAIKLGALYQY